MHLREFQGLMRELYYSRDSERGAEKTLLWLMEEVGELSEALLRRNKGAIMEELADIVAWTASLANVLGVDLEKAVKKKYPGSCCYCGSTPCVCEK
jgi:NTP pyrophosphatase (non-canonical NTP hydrolase)